MTETKRWKKILEEESPPRQAQDFCTQCWRDPHRSRRVSEPLAEVEIAPAVLDPGSLVKQDVQTLSPVVGAIFSHNYHDLFDQLTYAVVIRSNAPIWQITGRGAERY